jgi:PAS domain S-box-containing protein
MKHAVFPPQEAERLADLYRYEVLDTAPEKALDDLVHLAAFICQAPIALISLVDSDRQWFKSKIGLSATQTDRVIAFCAHTILSDKLFVVPSALADERFVDNPLVTGEPHIRFYCGAPLLTPDGHRIGTVSVIDRVPRELSPEQLEAMRVLSHQVMGHLTLERRHRELISAVGERLRAEQALLASQTNFQRLSDCTSSGIYIYSGERFLYANPAAQTITGYSLEELKSLSLWDLVHPDFHEALKARVRAVEAGDQAPARFEFPIIAKDRQIRWLDFTAASIEFEGQQARIGSAVDITGRKQAEALNEVQRHVLEMISRNKPLPDVMQVVVQSIEALSDGGVCTILLVDLATGNLKHGAALSMPEDFCRAVDGAPVGPQVGSCGTAAYRKATVIVTDIATDPLWAPWMEARTLILSYGFKACASIPILDSRGEVLGTYAMYYKSARGPTGYEAELLQVSSFLLGIALDRQRKDDALRVSEERMDAILSNSPLMVFVKDRAGRYLFTNRMFEQRFRLSHRQAIGQTDAELFVPDQAAAFQANDEKVLRSEMPMEFEERARYDDGDHTSIVTKFPLRQPDGTVYAVGSIVTDITERRKAEEQARRWEQVFAKSGFGLAYGNIVDNTLVAVNEAFARERGYTVAELVGKPIISVYPPELREAMKARFREIDRLGHLVYESVHRRKDGTTFPVLMEVTVIKDAQARPISRVAYALDISERKRAELELSESRERYALAVAGTADGIWDWNIVTNEDYLSPRWKELLGYEDHELPNRTESFFGLLHSDDMDRVQSAVRAHLERREPYSIELRLRRKDGSYGWFLSRGRALWDQNGKAVRMVGAITDIAERKETESALADRARQQAGVASLGQRALAGTELQLLFEQAVRMVATTFDVEYCKVLELLPDGSRLKLVAGVGWKEELVGHATVSGGQDSQAGYTLLRKELITVEDLRTERRFNGRSLLREHGVVSGISVIIGSISCPFGILGAYSTHRRLFSQDDAHFFQAVANVLAEAIQRRGAEEELQRSYHRLQMLGREIQWAEEKERSRLSRELHDEFGQLLSALRLSLARVREELAKRPRTVESVLSKNVIAASKAAEHLFVSLRELMRGLRPAVLDEFGLVVALESMAEDIREATGLECRLLTEPKNVDALIGQELQGALFRIAQELVTNVVRHAKATRADVTLRHADGKIALTVQDNGRGGRLTITKGKYGLRGIRERTELLGGEVEIRSERRRGTTVNVVLPVALWRRPSDSTDSPEAPAMAVKPKSRRYGKKI